MVSLCFCFPPSAKISTTRGEILISDLQDSDNLLTTSLKNGQKITKATPFVTYLHLDPELEATFLTIKSDNGSEIIISEDHLIFKTSTAPDSQKWIGVRAKTLQIGDELIHFNPESKEITHPKVTGIETRVIKGVYAPLSTKGTIIVDDFLTSCYANIDSQEIAHASFAPLRFWHRLRSLKFNKGGDNSKETGSKGIHKFALALSGLRKALPEKITPN